jgi:hypothetical protein
LVCRIEDLQTFLCETFGENNNKCLTVLAEHGVGTNASFDMPNLCTIQEKRLRLYNESYLKIVFIYGQVAGAHTVKLVLRLINQRSLPKAGKENGIIVLF